MTMASASQEKTLPISQLMPPMARTRQVRPDQGTHLRLRLAGDRAHAHDAARTRPQGRAQYGRLRLRLSRLAAGRARPAALEGQARTRNCRHRLPAGHQRGTRRHRLWGSQQAELRGEGKYDGVFGVWYGKGPGVDRSGDVFRHANLAGTSPHGGVLALMGDDHTAESSTTAHQSEFLFVDVMMPILNPAGVQEILDYGLYGLRHVALHRHLVGAQVREGQRRIDRVRRWSMDRVKIVMPDDFAMPPGGLNIRHELDQLGRKRGCTNTSATPMLAFIRANGLNRIVSRAAASRRSASSRRQVLSRRAPGARRTRPRRGRATSIGIRLYKIACPWPLAARAVRDFAKGLDSSSWSRRSAR
jgi:hypothetical protein